MEFRILGPLEVVEGERRLELGPPKQRAVLAALVVAANRVVSLDRLIDQLWGEEPPPRAIGSLQAYVSNLRRALEPQRPPRQPPRVLVTQPPGYRLAVEAHAVDAARFEAAAAEGRRLLEGGRPAEARRSLDQALALWRGPALGEFVYESFAAAEAARLEELRLVAVEDRLRADLEVGAHATAVAEAESLLGAHPLRERLWGLLMVALYRDGRQADALRAYQAARTTLGEELGLEPGPALRRLEADILAQEPTLEWRPAPGGEPVPTPSAPPLAPPAEPPPPGTAPAVSPFVGRQEEFGRLVTALERAAAGHGGTVLIHGEAGIGKTRLAEELVAAARARGFLSAWGGSVEGGGTPAYWPWARILRSLVTSVDPDDVRAAAGRDAAELSQLVPEIAQATGPVEPPSPALDPETARVRRFDGVARFLGALSESTALVVVLDDLQWADAASLQLLGYVAPRLRTSRVLVVGSFRPAEVVADHPLSDTLAVLARHQVTARVALEGLTEPEVRDLITVTTGIAASPAIVANVLGRTDGNPFFVSELARLLAADHRLGGQPSVKAVPAAVRDVVRQRLARLPDQTMALLSVAAVIGKEFDLSVLERAAALEPERTEELMEAALLTGMVVESSEAVGRLGFNHDLVRETVLDELTALRTARLHARVGEAIGSVWGHDDSHAVVLAHHYYSAVPVVSAEEALPYVLRAADVAVGRLAHEQAEQQLCRALELVGRSASGPQQERLQLDVLLRLSSVLAVTKGFGDAKAGEVLDRARALGAELGETHSVVRALFGLMLFHLVAGRYPVARELADQLLEAAAESARPADLVAAHLAVGTTAVHEGDLDRARCHLEQALELPQGLHDPALVAWFPMHPLICGSCFLAWAAWELGDSARATRLVEEALDFAAGLGHDLTTAHALDAAARIAVLERDAAAALDRSERALRLRGRQGSPLYAAIHAVHHGWARAQLGDPEAGIAELEGGLTAMEATGAWMLHTLFLGLLAEAQREAGSFQEALGCIDRAVEFVAPTGEHFWEAELHRLRGELLLDLSPPRVTEAETELRQALAIAEAQGARALVDRARQSLRRLRSDKRRQARL